MLIKKKPVPSILTMARLRKLILGSPMLEHHCPETESSIKTFQKQESPYSKNILHLRHFAHSISKHCGTP
jgi:hypothetical protein